MHNARDWIEANIDKGRDWIIENKALCEKTIGKKIAQSTLDRGIRHVIEKQRGIEDPLKPHEVKDLDHASHFFEISDSNFVPSKISGTVWGNEDNPNHRFKVDWVRRKTEVTVELIGEFFEQLSEQVKPPICTLPTYTKESNNLLEISIPDFHFGAEVSKEENLVSAWDPVIAQSTYIDAVKDIVSKAQSIGVDRILYVVGNDFFNVDTPQKTTTNGTPQDEGLHWFESFQWGTKLILASIDLMLQVAPVDIVVVPGNHDLTRAFYLGQFLSAWYRHSDYVTVDASPATRKYYRYGKNLIGFCHGDGIKPDTLPMKMAQDRKEDWAVTTHREYHIGHFHGGSTKGYQEEIEKEGVRVMTMSSLRPPDSWSNRKGYNNIREARGILWHELRGPHTIFQFRPVD